MVKAGEQSGALVDVLRGEWAITPERFAEVQSKFKSAMIYPIFVCCVGIVICIFFMTVMLPSFLKLFDGLHVQLPLTTRILIGINLFFKHWWWVMGLVLLAIGIIFKSVSCARPKRGRRIDRRLANQRADIREGDAAAAGLGSFRARFRRCCITACLC